MNHEMKLREIYFEKIKNGEKIYEIRLNDEKRQLLKIGDTITFQNESNLNDTIETKIVDLQKFDTFFDMASTLDLSLVGFNNTPKEKVVQIYHEFYPVEKETKYKVLAIKIQVVLTKSQTAEILKFITENFEETAPAYADFLSFDHDDSENEESYESEEEKNDTEPTKNFEKSKGTEQLSEFFSFQLKDDKNFSEIKDLNKTAKPQKLKFEKEFREPKKLKFQKELEEQKETKPQEKFEGHKNQEPQEDPQKRTLQKEQKQEKPEPQNFSTNQPFIQNFKAQENSDGIFKYNENCCYKSTQKSLFSDTQSSNLFDNFKNIEVDDSFSSKLFNFIDEKKMSDVECYKRANIDRKLFSKIRCDKNYQPSKKTVFAFAISLKLNLEETKDLLQSAGYSLSHSYYADIVIEYFIIHKQYNLFLINETLDSFNLQTI